MNKMKKQEQKVEIKVSELVNLINASQKLEDLESWGVDNWEGYGIDEWQEDVDEQYVLDNYEKVNKLENTTPKQRVEIEIQELQEKIDKLELFLGNEDNVNKVGDIQWGLLTSQYSYMIKYRNILVKRLEYWK